MSLHIPLEMSGALSVIVRRDFQRIKRRCNLHIVS